MPRTGKGDNRRVAQCTRCRTATTVLPVARHPGEAARQLLCSECLAALAPSVRQPSMQDRERADRDLQSKYGLSLIAYEEMLVEQDGGCRICHASPPAYRRLAVDHDHETGAVRGLLCARCNTALGLFGDDAGRVLRAAAYLRDVL